MPTYVPDKKTKRFVIISPVRQSRPGKESQSNTQSTQSHVCPFCQGNELLTPPEISRSGTGDPNTRGWTVRVVPNKYPITDIHEVVILSPQHTKDISLLPLEHVQQVMTIFHQRFVHHNLTGNVIIFGNNGEEGGASLSHPHAQIVVIPKEIPFDALEREECANSIFESENFCVYCPEFSQWPFEIWISPKADGTSFGEVSEEQRNALAFLLQKSIQVLRTATSQNDFAFHRPNKPFAYNYYISHSKNFYIRIIPRFIHRAGFELGTGLSVNTIPPIEAAAYLRNIWK